MARTVRFRRGPDIDKKISAFGGTGGYKDKIEAKYGCEIDIQGTRDNNFVCTINGGREESAEAAVRSTLGRVGITVL